VDTRRLVAIGIVACVASALHLGAAAGAECRCITDKPASASADEAAVRTILERMGPALPSLDAPSELPPAEQSIDDPLAVGGPVTDTKAAADQIASERDATAQELRQALDALASERLAKDAAAQELRQARDALASERLAKDAAQQELREARDALVSEGLAKDAATQDLREARDALVSERLAKDPAAQELREARDALASERLARDAAAQEQRRSLEALASERLAGHAAAQDLREARDALVSERLAKEAAAQDQRQARDVIASERLARDATAQELREARDALASEREKSSRVADEIARLLESTASLKTFVLARDAALQAMSEQHSAEIARERERSDQLAHDVTLARGGMAVEADRCEPDAHAAFGAVRRCGHELSSGLTAASLPLPREAKLSFLDPATPQLPFPIAAPAENSLRPAPASSEPVSSRTSSPRLLRLRKKRASRARAARQMCLWQRSTPVARLLRPPTTTRSG
jgi:uncharacterized coiled-coil DUF342 family protein